MKDQTTILVRNNKIYLTLSKSITYNDIKTKEEITSIGGKWDFDLKCWVYPFTLNIFEELLNVLPDVIINGDLERLIAERAEKERELEGLMAISKSNDKFEFDIPGFKEGISPFDYQKIGIKFASLVSGGMLLGDQMGLGKTIQSIGMGMYLRHQGRCRKVLLVTLASLKFNIPEDIKKFTKESYVVVDGDAEEREVQWNKEAFFYVTNYEVMTEDFGEGREIKDRIDDDEGKRLKNQRKRQDMESRRKRLSRFIGTFDLIVLDEAHAIRAHNSKRTEAIKRFLEVPVRIAMSGTPVDGKLEELHSIMEFVSPGLFPSKSRFIAQHAICDRFGKVTQYVNLDKVKERIRPFYLRRLKTDVMKDLPEMTFQNIYCELSDKEKSVYNDLVSGKHKVTEGCEEVVILMRAKQFCDLPSIVVDGFKEEGCKLKSFKELIDSLVVEGGEKVIIFSQFKQVLTKLTQVIKEMHLNYLVIDGDTDKELRVGYAKRFNEDPDVHVIMGTEAMSTGLNITGSSYVINYDDNWSPAIMGQRAGRAHRYGQKRNVTVINFCVRGTVEEKIRDVLYSKENVSNDLLGDGTEIEVMKRMSKDEMRKLLTKV